jgi:hypothetical protein
MLAPCAKTRLTGHPRCGERSACRGRNQRERRRGVRGAADRVARDARRGRALPPPRRSPRCQLRSFDCPCALYPEADEAQRAQISATFAREAQESTRTYARINGRVASRGRARDHLSNLIFYMRRLSSSMGSGDDASRQRRRGSCAASWSETKQTSSKWSRPSRDLRARGFALEAAARPAVRRF